MERRASCYLHSLLLALSDTGAEKISRGLRPYRHTPCSGPKGPSTVPEWTEVGRRELSLWPGPSLGPLESGLGLCPLSGPDQVSGSPGGTTGIRSTARELVRAEGAESWVPSGPFRLTSRPNIRITRGEAFGSLRIHRLSAVSCSCEQWRILFRFRTVELGVDPPPPRLARTLGKSLRCRLRGRSKPVPPRLTPELMFVIRARTGVFLGESQERS